MLFQLDEAISCISQYLNYSKHSFVALLAPSSIFTADLYYCIDTQYHSDRYCPRKSSHGELLGVRGGLHVIYMVSAAVIAGS